MFKIKQQPSDYEFIITTIILQRAVTFLKIIGETPLKSLKELIKMKVLFLESIIFNSSQR